MSDTRPATAGPVPLIDAEQAPILAGAYYPGYGPPSPVTASLAHVPEILELTLVAAATLMLNRYCSALRLPTSAATLSRLAKEGLA